MALKRTETAGESIEEADRFAAALATNSVLPGLLAPTANFRSHFLRRPAALEAAVRVHE